MVKTCKLCKQPLYHPHSLGIDQILDWYARDYSNSHTAYRQRIHPECYIQTKTKTTQTEPIMENESADANH